MKVFIVMVIVVMLLIVLSAVRVSDRMDEDEERQADGSAWEEDDD